MEETTQSTVNSEQSTVNQKTQITVHRSPSTFLITLLSVLLLISCLIAGFFAWQTQRLVAELRVKNEELIINTPTVTPTPDPTADWKTYTNSEYGFSFKYPSDFLDKKMNDNSVILSVGSKDYSLSLKADSDLDIYTDEIKDIKKLFDTKEQNVNIKGIGPYTAYLRSIQSAGGEFSFFRIILIPIKSYMFDLSLSPKDENDFATSEELADQILSTFKFIEPEASSTPLPVACTMEAKICPDGSYVGRSGPKCEFAACPTTSPQP